MKTINNKSVLGSLKMKLTGVMAAMVLAGCASVGPDYQAPSMQLNHYTQVSETVPASQLTQQLVQQNWWKQFGDVQLAQIIALANEHNPTLAAAKANVNRAMAIFEDVRDNDLPLGSALASYSAQGQIFPGVGALESDQTSAQYSPRVNFHSRQLGLFAGWQLDIVGKFARAEEAANADAEAAFYTWQEARLTLLSNVANSWMLYRSLQNRLLVAEETLSSLNRTQDIVQAQVDAGFATRLDSLRVEGQVAAVNAEIPVLKAQTEATRQLLIALAGGEVKLADFDWSAKPVPVLAKPVALEESSDFLKKRPDVLAAERRLASATAAIGVAKADLYPSLSLNGFLGFLSTQGSVVSGDAKAWSLTPGINWQALDLDSVYARIRAADARQEANLAQFEQTVLQAIAQTRSSLEYYTQSQQRLHALEAQVSASEAALELAKYQYKNGAIGLLDLLDVERQWLSSRDQQVSAQAQMSSALIAIYTALGGGVLV